ncbi:MAG: kynureninase [Betaproteobacteria bacterium]
MAGAGEPPSSLADCRRRDCADPLEPLVRRFRQPQGEVYLDGNSLGPPPRAAIAAVRRALEAEWAGERVAGWNTADWIGLPARTAARIAPLIGARPDEVAVADSVSVNLFKLAAGALALKPGRTTLLAVEGDFPTDGYMLQGLAGLRPDIRIRTVHPSELAVALDDTVALMVASHADYRTAALSDLAGLSRRASEAGALSLWDLSHTAGLAPIGLDAAGADMAVGCGYKYLNGGPGAPAFVYVAQRHLAAMADDAFAQPLSGWLGHRAPFDFVPQYEPAPGIGRFVVGTPSILALAALECGVETVLAAGVPALRAKSVALTELFIELVESRCQESELRLASPRQPARRGSQVCFAHPQAWPVMQALIGRGVIGDFRAPDILRFGFAPLYVSYTDTWDAAEALREVLATRAHEAPQYAQRKAVT